MDPLATAALAQLQEIHDDLRRVVRDLRGEALNWRPGEETNSIYVLVTHLLGAEHFWLAAAAGRPIARDRAAEFRAQGSDSTDLLRLLEQKNGWGRVHSALLVAQAISLKSEFKQAFADDAAAVTFKGLTGDSFVKLKDGILKKVVT